MELCLLLQVCSGCASIMCGDDKTVNISTEPPGAQFEVMNAAGKTIVQSVSPTNVTLKRGRGWFQAGDYTVKVHEAGYDDVTIPIKQGFETGWHFGGNIIVFGSLVGLLVVDPLTGAMWDIKDVHIALSPQAEMQRAASNIALSPQPATRSADSGEEHEYRIKKDASGNLLKDTRGSWIIEYVPKNGTQ